LYRLARIRKWDADMKLFCRDQLHWGVQDGKLVLKAPTDEKLAEMVSRITARLEAEIRLEVYEQICAVDFVHDKKAIVKSGIENVALQVQDICAQIALGGKSERSNS